MNLVLKVIIYLISRYRCRTLYEKFLLFDSENCAAWMKFAELETLLGDVDRARSIYELAVSQPRLDMPEILWKAFIDFEIEQEEVDRARDLYKRLLDKTQHVKVWLSFAHFELSIAHEDRMTQARHVYEEANKNLRTSGADKEHRLMLLEGWRDFEVENGDEKSLKEVRELMPKRVKKRRKIEGEENMGEAAGWEEYFDYIFPEDEGAKPNLKLLAMAKMWKKQKEVQAPEQVQAPDDVQAPDQFQAPAQILAPDQVQAPDDAQAPKANLEVKPPEPQDDENVPKEEEVKTETAENLDADDEDMKNESSSSEDDE